MAGGQYQIRVHGVLDDTRIRQQLAAIQKEMGTMAVGGKGKGKGGGAYFADVDKKAKGAGKTVTSYTQGIAKAEKAMGLKPYRLFSLSTASSKLSVGLIIL